MSSFINHLSIIFLSLAGLASCGLKYTPPETPENFETKRHKAIEEHISKSLLSDSISYSSIAFGDTKTIKPTSFRTLDSLFEIKYQNEQKMIYDRELDEIIASQRQIVSQDTAKIQYIEFHVFSFKEGDSIRIVEAEVMLDRSLQVKDETILSTILIPKKMIENYKRFLFNESFLYPGSMSTLEEDQFYAFFKQEVNQVIGLDKDELIIHILTLMDLAYRKKSVRTNELLVMQAKKEIEKISKELKIESVSEIYLDNTNFDSKQRGYYWLTLYVFDPSNPLSLQEYYFRFDELLRLQSVQKL
jgi:hypothetical protein